MLILNPPLVKVKCHQEGTQGFSDSQFTVKEKLRKLAALIKGRIRKL